MNALVCFLLHQEAPASKSRYSRQMREKRAKGQGQPTELPLIFLCLSQKIDYLVCLRFTYVAPNTFRH